MLGSDIDVQRAVFIFAIGQAFKLEAAFAVDEFIDFAGLGIETQFVDFDFRRSNRTGRIDKRTDFAGWSKVDQFVQLNVVINVFFPLQQEFIQRNAALAQRKLGQAVFRFGLEAQVFQRHIAFVGQFDLQRRRKIIVTIALKPWL